MGELRDRIKSTSSVAKLLARTYSDPDGQSWHVSEQEFSEYDRRSGRSLIFASDLAVRRVRNYPSDWFTLSDAELASLSWGV